MNVQTASGRKGRRIVAAALAGGVALVVGTGAAMKYGYLPGYGLFQTTGRGLEGNEHQFHIETEAGDVGK